MLFVSWLLSGRFSVGIATAVYNNGYSITLLVCLNGPCKSVLRVMHKTFKLPYFAKNNRSILTIKNKLYFKMTFAHR